MGSAVDRAVLEALARRAIEPSFPKQPSSRFQLWIELGDRLRREDVETLHELVAVPAVAENVVGLALEWEQSAAALVAAARAFANPDERLLSRARGAVAEALAGEDRAVAGDARRLDELIEQVRSARARPWYGRDPGSIPGEGSKPRPRFRLPWVRLPFVLVTPVGVPRLGP